MPTTVTSTIKSAGGDYPSMAAWVADLCNTTTGNLPADDMIAVAECYDFSDSSVNGCTIGGLTTDATRYVSVYVPPAERHTGTAGTGYRLTATGNSGLTINEENVRIEGIEVQGSAWCIDMATATGVLDVRISHCLIHDNADNNYGVRIGSGAASSVVEFWNNILYDCNRGGISLGDADITLHCYNNTFCDCSTSATGDPVVQQSSGTFRPKNNIVQNPNQAKGGSSADYGGSFTNAEYNLSADTSAPGTNAQHSKTVNFANEAGDDFTLDAADTAAKGVGIDLSADANLAFSDDILGTTRSDWSIGAHDFAAAGGATPKYVFGKAVHGPMRRAVY